MISKLRYSVRWVFFRVVAKYDWLIQAPVVSANQGIQDSLVFWIPHSGFQIPGIEFRNVYQWNLDSGFQSFVGSDSSSCIPDSKAEYSGFYLQEFPVFRNPLHGTRGSTLVTSGFPPNNFNAYFCKMVYWFQLLIGKPTLGLLTWAELLKAVKITQG